MDNITTRRSYLCVKIINAARVVGAIITVLLLVACGNRSSPAGADTAVSASLPFTHAGRWITDAQGRVLIIHGMNWVKKTPPLDPQSSGFGDNDIAWLAANGFDGLRLGVEPYGLEPQPGVFDDTYVNQLVALARKLASASVFPLIDFHEDDYGPAFNDNGFPLWMTQDDGLPHQPDCGFGCSQFVMLAMNRAWDHFWANDLALNGIGLQDNFAIQTAYIARAMASIDGLLGYEYLNEPWPGTQWPLCINPLGCPLFDQNTLTPFNNKIGRAIRAEDTRHAIYQEPLVTFNDGLATSIGALNDTNAGFAFHIYCLLAGSDQPSEMPGGAQVCPVLEELAFANADAHSAKTGEALLMTEFGATPALEVVSRITAAADAHMTSWLWWEYAEGTGLDPKSDPPDAKADQNVLDLLIRAYPRLVSGTPLSWSFDPAANSFTFEYSTQRADGGGAFANGAITEIFVPQRHYPHGYKVSIQGGVVQSATDAVLLKVSALPAATQVKLTVTAAP